MKGLNLHYIKYFCDAAKHGSVSASAKANFVTLSAVSQGISHLEKSLGIDLVAHHPNRFKLTPAGDTIFKRGCELLRKVDEFRNSLANEMGALEFASIYSFGLAVLPPYLKSFTASYPQAKVNFQLANNKQIKEMLRAGTIDFGIVGNDQELDDYDSRTIYTGHFELFVAADATQKLQENMGFILASYDEHENKALQEAYFKKFGRDLPVKLEVTSWEAIANLVTEGAGIGYLPDYMGKKRELLMKRYEILEMKRRGYGICTISPRGMQLRKSSQLFLASFINDTISRS
ncbi:MAG: LysR family transcriptional regulator [Chlamydiales bacterium]